MYICILTSGWCLFIVTSELSNIWRVNNNIVLTNLSNRRRVIMVRHCLWSMALCLYDGRWKRKSNFQKFVQLELWSWEVDIFTRKKGYKQNVNVYFSQQSSVQVTAVLFLFKMITMQVKNITANLVIPYPF